MENVYLVITPKELRTKTIAPSGKSYTRIRTAHLYFCMIGVHTDDPMIMYTEQKNQAIHYTEKEIRAVEKYLIDNEIKFSVEPVKFRGLAEVDQSTKVKQHINTSISEFI